MSQRGDGGSRSSDRPAPLYQRLPRGPHHLGREEVVRHQRLRMHGAMVEAVAASGYAGVSVKQVIALAGVSRRVFYEQFANKQECFLATFDLIAIRAIKRIGRAYRASTGDLRQRMAGAFAEFINELVTNARGASLAIVEAQTVGAPGLFHLRRTLKVFEQMLASSFVHSPEAAELPTPIVRGIVGGVYEAVSLRLREGRAEELPGLTDELVRWTLLFHTSSMPRMSACLAERARAFSAEAEPVPLVLGLGHRIYGIRGSEILPVAREGLWNGCDDRGEYDMPQQCRERLLRTVLNLTALGGYHELSAPQIFEAADVRGEVFFELFAGEEECFLAAFEEISYELLRTVADPDLVSAGWPYAVRRVIGGLMGLLATRPVYARMIAVEAPGAGPKVLAQNFKLAYSIATLLTEGASRKAHSQLALEGVAGAIWYTIGCQVESSQTHLLPTLADYLVYVVLAPFIGPDAAAEVVIDDQTPEERASIAHDRRGCLCSPLSAEQRYRIVSVG